MLETYAIDMTVRSLSLVLWTSLPIILIATLVGVAVSLFQALTQVQDQTLSFGFKLVAVFVALFFTVRWMGSEIYQFTVLIFDSFGTFAR